MAESRLDRLLAPWVFVLTGIVFNVLSAVITHYFIGLNNERIDVIDREIRDRQVLIDSLWQSRIEIERKQEFFILYLSGDPVNTARAEQFYRAYLDELIATQQLDEFRERVDGEAMDDLDLLLDLSNAAQASVIDSINDTYLETLTKQEAKLPLERANSRLYSIAIFLQVTGLILVLARDLRRR